MIFRVLGLASNNLFFASFIFSLFGNAVNPPTTVFGG